MPTLTCLFPGRFQPFHTGHLLVVKGMTKVCGRVVVAICSSDKKNTAENPFSAEERKEMIQAALQDANIIPAFDVVFIEVPDVKSDEEWAKKTLELAGTVHAVWTGNPHTKSSFATSGIQIKDIKEVPGISATEIRKLMKEGGDWKSKVPEAVADQIRAIDGAERVKKL